MNNVIAIDGPAGAGKSTLARLLARKLKYRYLDTGAMYRAVTWLALRENIDLDNIQGLTSLANNIDIEFSPPSGDRKGRIYVNGNDVTEEIRTPLINKNVSKVARVKGVRDAMVRQQRKLAQGGHIIIDGRDIGTRVVPDAEFKFFITASLEERARRRYTELKEKGTGVNFQEVKAEIARRDKIDSERECSPLTKPEDAFLIDTTGMSIDEVLTRVINIIRTGGQDLNE